MVSRLSAFFLFAASLGASACSSNPPSMPPPPQPRTDTVFDHVHIGSDSKLADFHVATAAVDLQTGAPFASVTLAIDLSSPCFPFSNWQTDMPPAGQNFPADCDAFDRNFEITLDDPVAPATTPPAIELMRAITPFGGPMHLDIDLTDVANGLPGMHAVRVMIPSYSDPAGKVSGSAGGWYISGTLNVTPGPAPRKVLAVIPLFNDTQTTPDPEPAVPFKVPAGVTDARIEYRVTGHGGGPAGGQCIGPAEEFCHRQHAVLVDDAKLKDVDPWRTDCATLCTVMTYGTLMYCAENPTGNMASVRAPRANWCPGSVTPPFNIDGAPLITAGDHTFRFTINDLAMGGNWRVSAVYFAFGG